MITHIFQPKNLVDSVLNESNVNLLKATSIAVGTVPTTEGGVVGYVLEDDWGPLTDPGELQESVDPHQVGKKLGSSQSRSGLRGLITRMLKS